MRIVHFADLHLGMENYGRIDPATGVSSRLLDFLDVLDQVVDYALNEGADIVVFCGDAYKNREPGQTHQREFARRINRLSQGGVPLFILTGNHDLPNASGRATSTEIFDALSVQNVYVSNRPDVHRIPTKSGDIQVVSLPWVRRSALLGREETKSLDFEQIKEKLENALTGIINASAAKLDPTLPAILAAHVWVAGAQLGSERLMTIGQEHALLLGNVTNPAFDYVALGHIHRHQVLSENPPVVYSGSLERVDFGEEADEKGFYVADIVPDMATGQRHTSFAFHPVRGRCFLTISARIEENDTDPTATVLRAIAAEQEKVKDAIVRLQISLPGRMEAQLRYGEMKSCLKEAYHFSISKEVRRENRMRLGGWSAEEVTPLDALKMFLETKRVTPTRARTLLEYGERLIQGEE